MHAVFSSLHSEIYAKEMCLLPPCNATPTVLTLSISPPLLTVTYVRTHWYGFSYFCRWYGSLIPRSLPAMAISGAIAGILSAGIFDESFGWTLTTWFEDPFSMQMFGVVFGYLSISRLTTTYNRYWEGVTHVSIARRTRIEPLESVHSSQFVLPITSALNTLPAGD
jgi:hypothetical protein